MTTCVACSWLQHTVFPPVSGHLYNTLLQSRPAACNGEGSARERMRLQPWPCPLGTAERRGLAFLLFLLFLGGVRCCIGTPVRSSLLLCVEGGQPAAKGGQPAAHKCKPAWHLLKQRMPCSAGASHTARVGALAKLRLRQRQRCRASARAEADLHVVRGGHADAPPWHQRCQAEQQPRLPHTGTGSSSGEATSAPLPPLPGVRARTVM